MSSPPTTPTQLGPLSSQDIVLKLPHPYLTEYVIDKTPASTGSSSSAESTRYRVRQSPGPASQADRQVLPGCLSNDDLYFTEITTLKSSELPPQSDNTLFGRSRRSPGCTFTWDTEELPSPGQIWLLVYVIFTIQPNVEYLRLGLSGHGSDVVGQRLKDVGLAVDLPSSAGNPKGSSPSEVLLLRSSFWQGAGSPFGPRPAWTPASSPGSLPPSAPLSSFPPTPLHYTHDLVPLGDPSNPNKCHLSRHPIRPAKPQPGSVIYSRWIPHLRETFSMIVLDPKDAEHVNYFHTWQNDPRVSQGWNETGTLEQHQKYIDDMHADPHQVAVLARFDDTCFAYFEIYWGKEDRLGAYYDAGDFDRGRHSLVGDVRFRGPHRVSAWWSSLVHYLFLDEPRTTWVVGEPKETNSTVVMYDLMHGFEVDKFVDLPHKRSAFVRCSRERFFQLSPLGDNEKVVGGLRIGLVPKL
ncbi:related to aerobactin siderophore biosynthesis protein iucB [Cephalotrichum gorgonifer]|uniref:Related to aerobactin siderophore biosynthesis protein iucB n=1 Tax=Cephalotrichum gorgonifer TaxID=2041049 RepID=A0AAE8N4T6_9PEZI|nr:related to aerobactin siderophore biosynthesis protein iucB [Cephalotrichum gorgonifer]